MIFNNLFENRTLGKQQVNVTCKCYLYTAKCYFLPRMTNFIALMLNHETKMSLPLQYPKKNLLQNLSRMIPFEVWFLNYSRDGMWEKWHTCNECLCGCMCACLYMMESSLPAIPGWGQRSPAPLIFRTNTDNKIPLDL